MSSTFCHYIVLIVYELQRPSTTNPFALLSDRVGVTEPGSDVQHAAIQRRVTLADLQVDFGDQLPHLAAVDSLSRVIN